MVSCRTGMSKSFTWAGHSVAQRLAWWKSIPRGPWCRMWRTQRVSLGRAVEPEKNHSGAITPVKFYQFYLCIYHNLPLRYFERISVYLFIFYFWDYNRSVFPFPFSFQSLPYTSLYSPSNSWFLFHQLLLYIYIYVHMYTYIPIYVLNMYRICSVSIMYVCFQGWLWYLILDNWLLDSSSGWNYFFCPQHSLVVQHNI